MGHVNRNRFFILFLSKKIDVFICYKLYIFAVLFIKKKKKKKICLKITKKKKKKDI